MLRKIRDFYNLHPKFRKVSLIIDDIMNKLTLFLLILAILISIVLPSLVSYCLLPEDIREIISPLLGGLLSLIIIPFAMSWYKNYLNRQYELIENNLQLYMKISKILIGILESTTNDTTEHLAKLTSFMNKNKIQISLMFDSKFALQLCNIQEELKLNSLENAKIPSQKFLTHLRKQLGLRGKFISL